MKRSDEPATRGDIEGVLNVVTTFMHQVDERFDRVDQKLAKHDKRFADLTGVVAELSAQVRDYHNESLFLNNHFSKLVEAVKQVAEGAGIKLKVEI